MRTEGAKNASARAMLNRLQNALERERDGIAVVDAADLAAAVDALRGLVVGDSIDRRRVKFPRTV